MPHSSFQKRIVSAETIRGNMVVQHTVRPRDTRPQDARTLTRVQKHLRCTFLHVFAHFLQSPHQVDMKNVVECQKEVFAYFNALET